jgi:ribosomal-protein-serine acetyltransferase
VKEGILREAEWLYDHYVDLVVYSMLKRSWVLRKTTATRGIL